nr:glutamate receptor-like [Penaeus vannamei]
MTTNGVDDEVMLKTLTVLRKTRPQTATGVPIPIHFESSVLAEAFYGKSKDSLPQHSFGQAGGTPGGAAATPQQQVLESSAKTALRSRRSCHNKSMTADIFSHLQWFDPQSYPSRTDLLKERFTNFHGHRLNIGALTDDFPLVFYADASKTTITGLAVMMLQELAGALNLTFSLEAATSRGITSLSWDGVARKMAAYKRDLIINGLPLAWDLARALDVSLPVLQTSYGIGLKTPVTAKRWETIAYPFGGRVWLALGVALVALALVFHGVARNTGSTVYVHKADVLSTLLWLSRTLVNQSVAQVPDVPGSRTLLCFWWLTALVITASYMGNLIAFLTVSAQPARMKTLEELAASGFPLSVNRGRFCTETETLFLGCRVSLSLCLVMRWLFGFL